MILSRAFGIAGVIGQTVVICGGLTGDSNVPASDCLRLSADRGHWKAHSRMSVARARAAHMNHDGNILIAADGIGAG